jgi:hypothetical protein
LSVAGPPARPPRVRVRVTRVACFMALTALRISLH